MRFEEEVEFDLKKKVEEWWNHLQKGRRCGSTSSVSKIVNKSTTKLQENARHWVAGFIKDAISIAVETKHIEELIAVSNAINACFDNFSHATDAANIAFNEIITFIDVCIDICRENFFNNQISKCRSLKALDLLHCLSRILVLILKLRRPLKCESKSLYLSEIDPEVTVVLAGLSYKVSNFLSADEFLMDTKCNLVMASLLIREIIVKRKDLLIKYHESFLATLPHTVSEKEEKLNMTKFLLGNAVLNTWANIVIDERCTREYQRFFIMLCESYSSNTAIILNVSRALLLLIKNESFKDFAENLQEQESPHINSLLSCIWMLIDHPIACVRHSSKDFLRTLATYEKFKTVMLNSLSSLPCDKRSYFITLAALADEVGSRSLLQIDGELPNKLILAVHDPTLVAHVVFALECLILKDSLVENFSEWCELWIVPLLMSLSKVPMIVAADIEKLLDGLLKRHPSAIFYIINKWSEPENDDELRYAITALKIYHRHGFKTVSSIVCGQKNKVASAVAGKEGKKWKDLISEKLLRFCLHHSDDDIRVSAFSLIIHGPKSTEMYFKQDFNLIKYFLRYNLNNQQPATRQKILSLMKKMLARFADSLAVIRRSKKSSNDLLQMSEEFCNYINFQDWLINFCFSNIFDGANFNRLNTVLNILLNILENIENFNIDKSQVPIYWKKILVALRSSYEENKVMAVNLAKKLNIYKYIGHDILTVKALFKRGYELCGKIEPPNVLTGAYLLNALITFPLFKKVAEEYVKDAGSEIDENLTCIQILMEKLRIQVDNAEENLIKAAAEGPMYGLLFAIRIIFEGVDLKNIEVHSVEEHSGETSAPSAIIKWSVVINDLIDLSFRMIHVVSCVVNSSSPEGHLPSDFQSDFDVMFSLGSEKNSLFKDLEGKEDAEKSLSEMGLTEIVKNLKLDVKPLERTKTQIINDCDRVIRRYNMLMFSVVECSSFSEKNSMDFASLLKDSTFLISEIDQMYDNEEFVSGSYKDYLQCLRKIQKKAMKCLNTYDNYMSKDNRPTAQALLLCAWRSIKEACLFLGGLMSKLSLEKTIELNIITEDRVIAIGEELRTLLCEIKHRGAFEQAYLGFSQLIAAVWGCPRKRLNELPHKWLKEILDEIVLPVEKQKMKFCSSRRSAGLPFLVQAIISSEVKYMNSAKIETLDITMNTLLSIVEEEEGSGFLDSKIHSLNILRAIFKHAALGEHVAPFVSRALMASIRGSRASAWSIRNSCSLLFSSLVIRIFGVARSKDVLSKKNRMTSRTFFQRYPELFEFFLSEMKLSFKENYRAREFYPEPNIFHILLVLGRLYPPPTEDLISVDFSEFFPLINTSSSNPTLKIRELGARALVSLLTFDILEEELDLRFSFLKSDNSATSNHRHGTLLQLKAIFSEILYNHELMTEFKNEKFAEWINNTSWILDIGRKCTSYVIKITYIQILHIIYKIAPSLRQKIKSLTDSIDLKNNESELSDSHIPGRFVYLETIYFLLLDIKILTWLESRNTEELVEFLLFMLKSTVSEVQALPLRFFLYVTSNYVAGGDEDDTHSISVEIKDLFCIQDRNNIEVIKRELLHQTSLLQYLINYIGSLLMRVHITPAPDKVIIRLWITVASTFLLRKIISISDFYHLWYKRQTSKVLFDTLVYLMDCGDSDICIGAFTCYSLCFFESIERNDKELSSDSAFNFTKRFFLVADPDADIKHRTMVSELFSQYYYLFNHSFFKKDNRALSIWMLPLRLMADDDAGVRKSAMSLVPKFQKCSNEKNCEPVQLADESQLTVIPLKAQENMLDCYIKLYLGDNLFHLIVQMIAWSLSAYINTINYEHTNKQNESGVFEKGNPNPFCEELTFANLVQHKLIELRSFVDMKSLLHQRLESTHIDSLKYFFPTLNLPHFPTTLLEFGIQVFRILSEEDLKLEGNTLLPIYVDYVKELFYLQNC